MRATLALQFEILIAGSAEEIGNLAVIGVMVDGRGAALRAKDVLSQPMLGHDSDFLRPTGKVACSRGIQLQVHVIELRSADLAKSGSWSRLCLFRKSGSDGVSCQ
jgi:hypothetical protein